MLVFILWGIIGGVSHSLAQSEGGEPQESFGPADWKAMADWLDFRNDGPENQNFSQPTPSGLSGGSSSNFSWGSSPSSDRGPRAPRSSLRRSGSHNSHDVTCDHDEFRRNYNTPSRVPDRMPIGEVAGLRTPTSPMARGGSGARRLAEAAMAEAAECRVTASHVRRRTGQARLCGPSQSKGKCYAAVKDALVRAGITRERLPGGSAYMAHANGYLRQAGMVNRVSEFNRDTAPEGCVLIYAGGSHGHGHSEIRTARGYCSDYCSQNPLRSQNYRLTGVYCLPE